MAGSKNLEVTVKTVVELDLFGYAEKVKEVEENLGVKVVRQLNQQIKEFVLHGLEVVSKTWKDSTIASNGDNAVIVFDDPIDAYKFAQAVHKKAQEHNKYVSPSAKRCFRIGAATGELANSANVKNLTGYAIVTAYRLEANAKPGEFLVDQKTYDAICNRLEQEHTFTPGNITDKNGAEFNVWRLKIIPRECPASKQQFYNALLTLNYDQQFADFNENFPESQASCFLIKGENGYGQEFLLHKLVKHSNFTANPAKIIEIHLGNETYVEQIWQKLRKSLSDLQTNSLEAIIARLEQEWQAKSVIIIIHYVENICQTEEAEKLYEFWQNLQAKKDSKQYRLLMFLVFHTKQEKNIFKSDEKRYIFQLKDIRTIKKNYLCNWIQKHNNSIFDCCYSDSSRNYQDLADDFYTKSNSGVFDKLLEQICITYHDEWWGYIKNQIKLG